MTPLPRDFFIQGSRVVAFRDGTTAHVFLSPDDKWRIPVTLDDVDPHYAQALLAVEDQRFFEHGGVDAVAVVRALVSNVLAGRVVSGASTITMQLVRVREPRPRTFSSKVVEAFRALQLEARYDKRRILEAYLQYIPFGRNLEGVEAASLAYFGHRANALSKSEIAILLAVPQSPSARVPSPSNVDRLTSARQSIARRLVEAGVFTDERVVRADDADANANATNANTEAAGSGDGRGNGDANGNGSDHANGHGHANGGGEHRRGLLDMIAATPVPRRLRPMPRRAQHAAIWLSDRFGHEDARIVTNLDSSAQVMAEGTFTRARADFRQRGIHNGAAVVVDHRKGEVVALVGNFEFWDAVHGGQIAGFDNPRSPGSALKPFIYAMGIDRGLLLPEHAITDTPRSYGSYAPRNYDDTFRGLVDAESALSMSLNVPFVELLSRLGVESFVGSLRLWGVESLVEDPGFYGLSAAIGGVELTPIEMAGLYAALAERGVYRPLSFVPTPNDQDRRPEMTAMSPGAAYLTRRALRLKDRPDFPARGRFRRMPVNVHWKTGTSYGHHDAWAVGSNAQYTAVVWLGNFDNTPSSHLAGAEAAGPILFDILEALQGPDDRVVKDDPVPGDLTAIEVCALSGRLPTAACPHRTRAWALRRSVPTETCAFHVEVDVDIATGLGLTPACRADRPYRTERFVVYPPNLRRYLRAERLRLPSPPAMAPGCALASSARDGRPPVIIEPAAGRISMLIPGMAADRQEIPLVAETESANVSWFLDGEYLGTVGRDERLWWRPRPGKHQVVAVDDVGRVAKRTLAVRGHL